MAGRTGAHGVILLILLLVSTMSPVVGVWCYSKSCERDDADCKMGLGKKVDCSKLEKQDQDTDQDCVSSESTSCSFYCVKMITPDKIVHDCVLGTEDYYKKYKDCRDARPGFRVEGVYTRCICSEELCNAAHDASAPSMAMIVLLLAMPFLITVLYAHHPTCN